MQGLVRVVKYNESQDMTAGMNFLLSSIHAYHFQHLYFDSLIQTDESIYCDDANSTRNIHKMRLTRIG